MPRIQPLILAAGEGSRIGCDKATLVLGGIRNLERILNSCQSADLPRASVVTGAHAAMQQSQRWPHDPHWVLNEDWRAGRSGSLRCGFMADSFAADGYLIWPVDLPLPGAELVESLAAAFGPGRAMVEPRYESRGGHPFIVSRALAREIAALTPGESPRPLFRSLGAARYAVEVSDASIHMDIDELSDLQALERRLAGD